MQTWATRYKNQAGFTLVELIITATFVAAAGLAIVSLFITIGKLSTQSRNLSIVTAIAEQKLETYRNAPFTAIPLGTPAETFTGSLPANLGTPKSAVANVATVQSDLKKVDVVVTWYEGTKQKQIRMSTLVAKTGINR